MHEALFQPLSIGEVTAANRIFMAPLTRARSDRPAVPNALMAEYYAQRAGAGLIISEATAISPEGRGWPDAPGLWTADQVEGWKTVTHAVHAAGGLIHAQLWHMGRLVHPDFLDGAAPVSASATQAPGYAHTYAGKQDYGTSRPLTRDEIARVVDDYAHAARNAIAAGFDGVQLHAANGYLIDQFLRASSNQRDDDYGGSIENRARLAVEVLTRLADAVGPGRVSVRFSPNGESQGVSDPNPTPLFAHVARSIDPLGLAFVELREGRVTNGTFGQTEQAPVSPVVRPLLRAPLVLNGDYTPEEADEVVREGRADAIAFGRPFIGNPDLVARVRSGAALAESDIKTWYSAGPEGYTDYPALAESPA